MTNIQFYRSAIDASECVSNAWELVKRNIGLYIGAGVVTVILIGCIPIVNFFLLGPMMGGFSYLVLRDMRNEPVDFGMLFKGFDGDGFDPGNSGDHFPDHSIYGRYCQTHRWANRLKRRFLPIVITAI